MVQDSPCSLGIVHGEPGKKQQADAADNHSAAGYAENKQEDFNNYKGYQSRSEDGAELEEVPFSCQADHGKNKEEEG